MSKAIIALALVAAYMGLASALKQSVRNVDLEQEEVVEIEPVVHSHSGGSGSHFGRVGLLGHVSDEVLIEELKFRGIGCGCGFGSHGPGEHGGHLGLGVGPVIRRRPIGIRPRPSFQHGPMFPEGGLGGGVGKGGYGGFSGGGKGSGGSIGVIRSPDRLGAKEVGKGALVANKNNIEVSGVEASQVENEGIRKHQVIDNDKTIIKNHVSGVNDVEGFRSSIGNAEAGRISGGSSQLAAEGSIGRLEASKEAEHEFGAHGHESGHAAGGGPFADI